MRYKDFRTEDELKVLLNESFTITGNFFCEKIEQSLSDDCYTRITFKNCIIVKAVFISCSFNDCTFKNVVFREVDFAGTDFTNCQFKNCVFSNVTSGFSVRNSFLEDFSEMHEEESSMDRYIKEIENISFGTEN